MRYRPVMRPMQCKGALAEAFTVLVLQRDLIRFHGPHLVAVAVNEFSIDLTYVLDKLVDEVDARRRVHPARVLVEALVDEKLPPRDRTVGIEPFLADHVDLATEVERRMRIDQQHGVAGARVLTGNSKSVGGVLHTVVRRYRRLDECFVPVELGDLVEGNSFDIAADRAFEEIHRHPRLESLQQRRLDVRVGCQVVIEAVRIRIAQRLQPVGGSRISRLGLIDGHVQARPHVAEDGRFAIDLGQPPGGPDVIALDAREVVLGLRIQHAEHGIGIGFAIDVRHAVVIADNLNTRGNRGETIQLRVASGWSHLLFRRAGGKDCQGGEQRQASDDSDHNPHHSCRQIKRQRDMMINHETSIGHSSTRAPCRTCTCGRASAGA